MNTAELNNVKTNLSLTYIRAVAAKLNYSFQESPREIDGIGIDCFIFNRGMGTKSEDRAVGNEVKLQVKAFSRSSNSMYKETAGELEYNLPEGLTPTGANFYLVVVEIPEEANVDDWISVTPELLTLKKCAYYIRVSEPLKSGFVKIPKSNRFCPESLPSLFISSTDKEKLL